MIAHTSYLPLQGKVEDNECFVCGRPFIKPRQQTKQTKQQTTQNKPGKLKLHSNKRTSRRPPQASRERQKAPPLHLAVPRLAASWAACSLRCAASCTSLCRCFTAGRLPASPTCANLASKHCACAFTATVKTALRTCPTRTPLWSLVGKVRCYILLDHRS